MQLVVPVLVSMLVVVVVYLADKYSRYGRLPWEFKQGIVGLVFGGVSAFASGYGVELLGTVVNVRDAAPISAGLIFGAPAGVIAGVIGGAYRWFSVYWGAGMYTRVGCTLATVLAGVLAAVLRRKMFDDKRPTWGYGVAIAVVCEVLHMLLIFLTNMEDSVHAFEFVKGCTVPMLLGNGVAVGASIAVVSVFGNERLIRGHGNEQIAQTFQRWLMVCIVVAFFATSFFTYALQNGMSRLETQSEITVTLEDVHNDITDASDRNLLEIAHKIKNDYLYVTKDVDELARKYNISEVNVIDRNFIIVKSSVDEYIGYDMASGEQSAEFRVLLEGQKEFAQEYRQTSYDEGFLRKYAGVAFESGGFIQVGYDSEQFQEDIRSYIVYATENRHVGRDGFVAICDEDFNILSSGEYNGKSISTIGIDIDTERMKEHTVYETQVKGKDYLFGYTCAEGFYIVGAMPVSEAMFMRDVSLYTSVFMQIIVFALLFVFIYFLIKKVIINNLRKVNMSLAKITDGNLNETVDVRSNQEFASLSDDINSTVDTLKKYIAEAAARIDRELEYAKQIQLAALPTKFPENEEYGIFAQMIAAKEVGGDFYDFYKLNDTTVAFLAADVSGKGIPAAMFMMTAKTIIKDLAERGMAVNDIFTLANEKLCENNEAGMFVTAWMGVLDTDTGLLKYANAGHNPPLVLKSNGEFEYLKSRAGFVLAGMEGIKYRLGELQLQRGDRIFLYTDGVTEATDAGQQMYGEDRLQRYMNQNRQMAASELLKGLKEDIDEFVGEAPQFDDITMLMFDYFKGGSDAVVTERIFPAQDSALSDVIAYVEEVLEQAECPMKTVMGVCVAIEEVFVNVAHYAYGEGMGDVKLAISADNGVATFVMRDRGVPFDPLAQKDPDITLSAEERTIGGLGIYITRKTMDEVKYSYENGENVLTMIKRI